MPKASILKADEPCPTCGMRKHITRTGKNLRKINWDLESRKAFTIISRDLSHLLKRSVDRPLLEEESSAVRGYVKLIRDLKEVQAKEDSIVSEEDLASEVVIPTISR